MSTSKQFCTFSVCGVFLGINVLSVQEVLKARELTLVPLASEIVEGLLNLRGQIVTAIDLRRRLGFQRREPEAKSMFMIIRTDKGPVAFVVDSVGDVVEVTDESYENAPDTLPPGSRSLVSGVYKLPQQLLHVLDAEQASALS